MDPRALSPGRSFIIGRVCLRGKRPPATAAVSSAVDENDISQQNETPTANKKATIKARFFFSDGTSNYRIFFKCRRIAREINERFTHLLYPKNYPTHNTPERVAVIVR